MLYEAIPIIVIDQVRRKKWHIKKNKKKRQIVPVDWVHDLVNLNDLNKSYVYLIICCNNEEQKRVKSPNYFLLQRPNS